MMASSSVTHIRPHSPSLTVLVFLSLLLAGCGSSDKESGEGYYQIINAIDDSPSLSINIDENQDDDDDDSFLLDFRGLRPLAQQNSGEVDIEVVYTDPATDEETVVIGEFPLTVYSDDIQTLVLTGTFASPETLLFDKPFVDLADDDLDQIEIQLANLSTANDLNIYFESPGRDLESATPVATLNAGQTSNPISIEYDEDDDTDDFQLSVLDSNGARIFESDDMTINVRSRRLFILDNAPPPNDANLSAFMVTDTSSQALPNQSADAAFRIVNAVADLGAMDIMTIDPSGPTIVSSGSLAFPTVTSFLPIDPGFVSIDAVSVAPEPEAAITSTVSFNEETFYTVVVAGLGSADDLFIRATESAQRTIATEANIQFVNTHRTDDDEDLDRVDLYLLEIGDSLDDVPPAFSQVGFLDSENLTSGTDTFDLVVTLAGTQSIIAGPTRLTVAAGESYLILAADAFGGGEPAQIVIQAVD